GDQPGRAKECPRRTGAGREGRGDSEPFGHVVEAKSNDQNGGQLDRTGSRCLPDRQTFREVVETDSGCDGQREVERRGFATHFRRANEGTVEVDETEQSDANAGGEDGQQGEKGGRITLLGGIDGGANWLTCLAEDVPEEEHEDTGRQGVEKG